MASKNLPVTTTTTTSPPSKSFAPEGDASRTDSSEESQEMTLLVQDLLEQMVRENPAEVYWHQGRALYLSHTRTLLLALQNIQIVSL